MVTAMTVASMFTTGTTVNTDVRKRKKNGDNRMTNGNYSPIVYKTTPELIEISAVIAANTAS
jgi:hypothetical protein